MNQSFERHLNSNHSPNEIFEQTSNRNDVNVSKFSGAQNSNSEVERVEIPLLIPINSHTLGMHKKYPIFL